MVSTVTVNRVPSINDKGIVAEALTVDLTSPYVQQDLMAMRALGFDYEEALTGQFGDDDLAVALYEQAVSAVSASTVPSNMLWVMWDRGRLGSREIRKNGCIVRRTA